MPLNDNALIDVAYYFQMKADSSFIENEQTIRLVEDLINAVSTQMERFCNRKLKAADYTYDDEDEDNYDVDLLHYAVFDPPADTTFWFPTYPVNSLSEFLISDVAITETTEYDGSDGYILYLSKGKLIYYNGFDYGYFKNIKIKWNGGYTDNHPEMQELQYLCFEMVRLTIDNLPKNTLLESEKIGNYAYKMGSIFFQKQLSSLSPNVYTNLGRYRKEPFA